MPSTWNRKNYVSQFIFLKTKLPDSQHWCTSEVFWTLTNSEYSHWFQPLIQTPWDSPNATAGSSNSQIYQQSLQEPLFNSTRLPPLTFRTDQKVRHNPILHLPSLPSLAYKVNLTGKAEKMSWEYTLCGGKFHTWGEPCGQPNLLANSKAMTPFACPLNSDQCLFRGPELLLLLVTYFPWRESLFRRSVVAIKFQLPFWGYFNNPWSNTLLKVPGNPPTKVNLPGQTSSKDLFTWTEA